MEITNALLEKAVIYATEKHKGQKRKGNGLPYILHPMRVMFNLMEAKQSSNLILMMIAALLHDTCEDCGVSLKEIARLFGYQVASLVEELTLDKTQYERQGKAQYLLNHMLKMSSYALCIKLSDRTDNIIDTKDMKPEFRKMYKAETEFILNGLKTRRLTKTHKFQIRKLNMALKKVK